MIHKHHGRAVRAVIGMALCKVPHNAIHLFLVSQDTEFSPRDTQLLGCFMQQVSWFVSDALWLQITSQPHVLLAYLCSAITLLASCPYHYQPKNILFSSQLLIFRACIMLDCLGCWEMLRMSTAFLDCTQCVNFPVDCEPLKGRK